MTSRADAVQREILLRDFISLDQFGASRRQNRRGDIGQTLNPATLVADEMCMNMIVGCAIHRALEQPTAVLAPDAADQALLHKGI